MSVNAIMTTNTIKKKKITDFCKDKLDINLILNYQIKIEVLMYLDIYLYLLKNKNKNL